MGPIFHWRQKTRTFRRQVNTGFLAKTKVREVLVVAFLPKSLTNFCRPDVTRVLNDLGKGQGTIRVMVVNGVIAHLIAPKFTKHLLIRPDSARVEGGSR